MTEAEADALVEKRNLELGNAGETDRFFMAVRDGDGNWRVEEGHEKRGIVSRVLDAMPWVP